MPRNLRLSWVGLDYILRSIKNDITPTVEEMLSKEFLVAKSRIQTDIGAVKKQYGREFEGIRLKQDFVRNAIFRQNNWQYCPLELNKDDIPIGIHGVFTGK